MNRESWTRPGGPQAPLLSTHRPVRDRRRAALRALAVCCTAVLPLRALAQACTTPTPVPASYVQQGAQWSQLQQWMSQNGITFVAGDSARITPCPARIAPTKCAPMIARVDAVQNSNCLSQAMVTSNSIYFVGLVRRYSGWDPANLGFGTPNPTDTVYLLVQGGQAMGLFHDSQGKVRSVAQANHGWRFRFHVEDTTFQSARARWRPDSSHVSGLVAMHREPHVRGGPSTFLPDDADDAQMADPAYAWMSCAAGCCQFHGSGAGGGMGDPPSPNNPGPHPHPGHNPPGNRPGNRPERE